MSSRGEAPPVGARRRWLVIAGLAAVIMVASLAAHERFDRRPRAAPHKSARIDASEVFAELARGGIDRLDSVRSLAESTLPEEPLAEVEAILPKPDEAWVSAARALARRTSLEDDAAGGPRLCEPRGRLIPGRVSVFVEAPADATPLHVELFTVSEPRRSLAVLEVKPAVRAWTPNAIAAGVTGLAILRTGADEVDRSGFEVIDAGEREAVRDELRRVTALVSDLRARRYAQAVVAMSHGLYREAAKLLLDRPLPRPARPVRPGVERGLELRRAFLAEYFGRREELAQALSRVR